MTDAHRLYFWLFLCLFSSLLSPAWGEDVAVILSRTAPPYEEALKGFKANAAFSCLVLNMEGDEQKWPKISQAISQGSYQAVVTIGSEATLKARELPAEIPVVYSMVLFPITSDNRNLSGVHIKIEPLTQIMFMKKMFPGKNRLGVIYNPQYTGPEIVLARAAASQEAVSLLPIAIERPEEIPQALAKLTTNSVDIIWMLADPTVGQPAAVNNFITHERQQRLPVFGFALSQVKAGIFAAFMTDYADIGRQSAELTARVINGKTRNVHEGPKQLVVYVNPRVRKALGLGDFPACPEVQFVPDF